MSGNGVSVVLAHGAWADGSSWRKVIDLLEAKSVTTIAAGLPLTSLADDVAALDAVVKLARTEGILPALESAHAVAEAIRIAPTMAPNDILVVNLSGRGDKDMGILARELKL